MKDIVNKLECIVFAGIILLRNEKKRRREWKKKDWGFWIIYWFFMPILHIELVILLLLRLSVKVWGRSEGNYRYESG